MSETPVKRPRGRPRKQPQSEQISSHKEKKPTKLEVKASFTVDDDDAGEMKEQAKLEVVNTPEPEEKGVELPPPAPEGWRWVYNRLPEPYEAKFNSQPTLFEAHEFKQVSAKIAPHICSWSIVQLPATGPPVRALVLEGKKGFGVPLKVGRPQEMIDRSSDPNPTGRGTDGIPTKPKLIYIN